MPFLTFEGIDGSGKSSLLNLLSQHLRSLSLPIEITREPGGSNIGPELREILLRTEGSSPCPEAELLIYEADRAQHVALKIKPWLKAGKWVLSDRFADSSRAFQGAGRHLKQSDVIWLNNFATQGLVPNVTVLIDIPVEEGAKRRAVREKNAGIEADRFEKENHTFHQAVRDEYLKLAKEEPHRFVVLNGQNSPSELLKELLSVLKAKGLL